MLPKASKSAENAIWNYYKKIKKEWLAGSPIKVNWNLEKRARELGYSLSWASRVVKTRSILEQAIR